MQVDVSEVRALERDLAAAGSRVVRELGQVASKGALNIKNQMRSEARGVRHAPGMPADITYDRTVTRSRIAFEVGPTTGDVGSLALLYYGNSRTAPVLKDPAFALHHEAPVIERYMDAVIDGVL
ncbi:hypothetical protein [Phycicoccus sp. 3266]|uniref:hypothetical protein n=1 Tax=Phycicoccus sp. 3266 TaxID=2817751 RepID=UPI00285828E0|nr:hypothetical protein [Phycicoccus sp. 3266]MDR6861972.1 hypothetical protein [Phycicoccus sp. 3266]